MSRSFVFVLGLALVAPAAFAQTAGQLDPGQDQALRRQEMQNRQAQNAAHEFERGQRQAWLNSMANLTKLRSKLAEAWQGMGMSPQGAKLVADAYEPNLAAHIHHESLRGKSDQEIAGLLQTALKQKRYLDANQMLIDYERNKLKIGANPSPDVNR